MISRLRLKRIGYVILSLLLILVGVLGVFQLMQGLIFQIGGASSFLVLGILLMWFFTNEPMGQKSFSYIARAFSFWKKGELVAVGYHIEGTLNAFKEKMDDQVKNLIVGKLRIIWVQPSEVGEFLDRKSETVIIRMKDHGHQAMNLAHATLSYISTGTLPQSRLYISNEVSRSLDFTLTKKVLVEQGENEALNYFATSILAHELEQSKVRSLMISMEQMDEKGYFTRLFLRELQLLGSKLFPTVDIIAVDETEQFLRFVHEIAIREPEEKTPLIFHGKRVKVGIVLIAHPQTLYLAQDPTKPYVYRVMMHFHDGAESVYLCAWGNRNITLTKMIATILEDEHRLQKMAEETFSCPFREGMAVSAILCIFRSKEEII